MITLCCSRAYYLFSSIGYVEFRTVELVDKAISRSGTIVMGLPIQIRHTAAERNRLHAGDRFVLSCRLCFPLTDNYESMNLPPGVSAPHGGMQ